MQLLPEKLTFLAAVALLSLMPFAQAIRCWSCSSDTDPSCSDPFDNSTYPLVDCDQMKRTHLGIEDEYDALMRRHNEQRGIYTSSSSFMAATSCRKIRQNIYGTWRTIRGCGFSNSRSHIDSNDYQCKVLQGTNDFELEYCMCDNAHGCNEAANLVPRFTLPVLLCAFVYLFVR